MLKVVVLNWKNYLGRGEDYVSRMRNMVARHLTIPHRFIDVTEHDLEEGFKGWFNKLWLLTMFPDDEVLYLDLDVVISRNINHLVELARTDASRIWARDDWSYSVFDQRSGREKTINSSVLIWNGKKDMSGVTQKMLDETHGDQGILTQLFWPHGIGLLPNDSIKSYKYDALEGRGYGDICVFHGEPKNHQVKDEWVQHHWR